MNAGEPDNELLQLSERKERTVIRLPWAWGEEDEL